MIAFLVQCRDQFRWGKRLPPIQSGVGNVANAIVGQLYDSPFEKIRFWTEVFQDGMLRYVEDDRKFEYASATAVSFSAEGAEEVRASASSGSATGSCCGRCGSRTAPEIISRLFVIAMNTPIEVDIYGHVNSTHIDGSRIVNGLGGSGDFFRNAYLSIVHTPSIRTAERRTHGELRDALRPPHRPHRARHQVRGDRARLRAEHRHPLPEAAGRSTSSTRCAHPHFRPLLHAYLEIAGAGDEPRPTDMAALAGWWKDYEQATRSFPQQTA